MISVIGDARVKRAALPVEIIRPSKAGSRWKGCSHRDMANEIVKQLKTLHVEVVREEWALARKGQVLMGGLDLRMPRGYAKLPGQDYSLGILTGNDLHKAHKFCCGSRVLICKNGVMTGEYVMRRRHTLRFDLEAEVHQGLLNALEEFKNVGGVIENLQKTEVNERTSDHLLMEAGRRRILPWSKVGEAWELYVDPPHKEFEKAKGTAWGVYQAVNQTIKARAPRAQLLGLQRLTSLLLSADTKAA